MTPRTLGLLSLAALLLASPSGADAPKRGLGVLTGTVKTAAGAPLDEVSITAPLGEKQIQATTNGKGRWTLPGIGSGAWVLTFRKDGYAPKQVRVIVKGEQLFAAPIDVTLDRR